MSQLHPAPMRVKLRLASDALAVRDGLRHLLSTRPLSELSSDLRGSTEIVLAEVLNNIVEHAYALSWGPIDVTLDYQYPTLSFEVVDAGLPMPSDRLPSGDPISINVQDDLPEGGYGWFLIRSLTRGLVYHRRSNRNTLAFWMDAD